MEKYQLLFESVFKKDPAGADTVDFLEKITEAYPYFSTAQFYLLHSLKKDSPGYKKQVKKAAAIFNNNHWLNFQLMEAGMAHTSIVDQQKFSLEEKVPVDDNEALMVAQTDVLKESSINESIELDAPIETAAISPIAGLPQDTIQVADQTELVEMIISNEPSAEQIIETAPPAAPAESISISKADNTPLANQPEPVDLITNNERREEPVTEISVVPQPETVAAETTNEVKKAETEIPPFKLSVEPFNTNIPADAPLFDPLHTTDYFASVGIKLSEEAKSADKLGKQLRSFTEWLKTMKKVHAEQLMKSSTPAEIEADNTESNIQQLAEKSNEEDEVVTEAMADVLLQQGRKNKALEVLEKLSLLDPGKSAYFAAKINQIKEP